MALNKNGICHKLEILETAAVLAVDKYLILEIRIIRKGYFIFILPEIRPAINKNRYFQCEVEG